MSASRDWKKALKDRVLRVSFAIKAGAIFFGGADPKQPPRRGQTPDLKFPRGIAEMRGNVSRETHG